MLTRGLFKPSSGKRFVKIAEVRYGAHDFTNRGWDPEEHNRREIPAFHAIVEMTLP